MSRFLAWLDGRSVSMRMLRTTYVVMFMALSGAAMWAVMGFVRP